MTVWILTAVPKLWVSCMWNHYIHMLMTHCDHEGEYIDLRLFVETVVVWKAGFACLFPVTEKFELWQNMY